jgi:hypothetical protein
MRKKWIIAIPVCLVLLLTILAVRARADSQTYSITGSVSAAGGGERSSPNYNLEDAIGAPAIGVVQSGNFSMAIGSPDYDRLNHPPAANPGGPYLLAVSETIQLTGKGSDPDQDKLNYYPWTQIPVLGTFVYARGYQNPTFTAGVSAGLGIVSLTLDDGILQDSAGAMLVVYNPNGGFVTGGGWINSPAGSYSSNPSITGKCTLGFVSRYEKGAKVPTGNTEFQFQDTGMNFKSTSYDWLVVTGAKAEYKGSGTINGAGNYAFILIAVDGKMSGSEIDKFRLKIWDKATGSIIYDNEKGASVYVDPVTPVSGGNIVIHK